jgi:prephenate dehydrogenase
MYHSLRIVVLCVPVRTLLAVVNQYSPNFVVFAFA